MPGKALIAFLAVLGFMWLRPALATPNVDADQGLRDQIWRDLEGLTAGGIKPTNQQIVDHAKQAVVTITAFDKGHYPLRQGTGFFFDEKLSILTNYHVVPDAESIEAQTESSGGLVLTRGYIDRASPNSDVAIVQFPGWDGRTSYLGHEHLTLT